MKKGITVADVIEHLKTLPQDAICVRNNNNTLEQTGEEPLRLPTVYETGNIVKCTARDAFDGTTYTYDRYDLFGGDETFVKF